MPSPRRSHDQAIENPWMRRLTHSRKSRLGFGMIAFSFLALTTTLAVSDMTRSGYINRVHNWKMLMLPVFAFQLNFLSHGLAPFLGLLARRELEADPLLPECATTFLTPADYLEPLRAAIRRWFIFGAIIAFVYLAVQVRIWRPFLSLFYGGISVRIPRSDNELLYLLHALHIITMLNQLAGFNTRAGITAATELRRLPFYGGAIAVMVGDAILSLAALSAGMLLFDIPRLMLSGKLEIAVAWMIGIQAFFLASNFFIAGWIWRRAERNYPKDRERQLDQPVT